MLQSGTGMDYDKFVEISPAISHRAGDPFLSNGSSHMVTANNSAAPANRAWPDDVPMLSIYDESRKEEDRFKWIESEKVGYDLGEQAVRLWMREHWNGYLRARWLEHLQGKCFWIELDRGDFGLLIVQFQDRMEILSPILDRLKCGQENLNIIDWAKLTAQPIDEVILILEALDINSRRLVHRFDAN